MPEITTTIAAARQDDYTPDAVRDAIVRALEPLGGIKAYIKPGSRVLLKPNFVRAMSPDTGAVTHPVFIAECARLIREAGAERVMIGDSPAFGSAANAARAIGLTPLLEDCGAEIVEFKSIKKIRGLDNGRFKMLGQAGIAHEADVLINLPKAKAHCQMVMTCAVKNLYGCIPGRRKALMHCLVNNSRYLFGRMLADNARSLAAELHIADGIITMQGMGPTRGTPRHWGWVVAGTDPFALDRVVADAMGYAFDELPHLQAAAHMHAGETRLEHIDLIGATLEELRIHNWQRAHMLPVTFNPLRLCIGYLKHLRQLT